MKRLVAFVLYTSFLFADKIVFTDELVIYGELTNISDVHALDPRTGSEQEVYFKVSKATLRKLEKNKNNHIIGIFDENVVIFNMNVIREFDLELSDKRLLSKISKAGKKYTIQGVDLDSPDKEPSYVALIIIFVILKLFAPMGFSGPV